MVFACFWHVPLLHLGQVFYCYAFSWCVLKWSLITFLDIYLIWRHCYFYFHYCILGHLPGTMLILHYLVDIIILPFMLLLHSLAKICWFVWKEICFSFTFWGRQLLFNCKISHNLVIYFQIIGFNFLDNLTCFIKTTSYTSVIQSKILPWRLAMIE